MIVRKLSGIHKEKIKIAFSPANGQKIGTQRFAKKNAKIPIDTLQTSSKFCYWNSPQTAAGTTAKPENFRSPITFMLPPNFAGTCSGSAPFSAGS
jgi:hypothetical protein